MSLPVAKRMRRDLRRAFGPDVLETVDTHGAVIEQLANTSVRLREDLQALASAHAALRAVHDAFQRRGWPARLCWVVTGR